MDLGVVCGVVGSDETSGGDAEEGGEGVGAGDRGQSKEEADRSSG